MRHLLLSPTGIVVLLGLFAGVAAGRQPIGGAPADEDPEVAAYVKKKGWSLYRDLRIADSKRLIYLVVEKRGKLFEDVTLSADDYKMIAKSKTVQILDLGRVKNTTDEGLKAISAIPQLEGIIVKGDDVTDAGVKALAKCRSMDVVVLMSKKVTDAGIKELAALPRLRWLHLGLMKLDGSAFEAFARSKTLRSVTLTYVDGFTDEGAKHLAKLANLNELKIETTGFGEKKLTAAGIRAIVEAHLPAKFEFDKKLIDDDLLELLVRKGWLYGPTPPGVQLLDKKPATPAEVKVISLGDSKVTDKGMRAVLDCTNARSLHLGRTAVTDETIKKLSAFKNLDWLSLERTKVTGAGLAAVAGLPIKHIGMEGCALSEDAFRAFGKMTALEDLWLADAKMKAEWLKHLAGLPKLKELNLRYAAFDDAAVKYVRTMPNLQDLSLTHTQLGDAGFRELIKLPKLRHLNVDGTKVTKEVYRKAKKEHPKISLSFYDYDR